MVHFLLENGANMDHKTDEMHNALMEACMVSSATDVKAGSQYLIPAALSCSARYCEPLVVSTLAWT